MSSTMKISLLALISTAAAVPHNGHSRFHKPSGGYGGPGTGVPTGAPYPTGSSDNSTALPFPTASGAGAYPNDLTTTVLETLHATETLVSTIYATKSTGEGEGEAPSSVGVVDVSTGAAVCGPETVTVTATNQITVTVPAEGAASSANTPPASVAVPASSAAASSGSPEEYPASSESAVPEVSSAAPEMPAPSAVASSGAPEGYPVASETAVASSSAVEAGITMSFPNKPVETPAPVVSEAPVESEAPASSAAEVPASSVAESSAAVSSATPKASSTPSYSGGKRGLAYNDVDLCKSFSGGKFSFAYNWAQTENGELPEGTKFVPMMHKTSDSTADEWLANVKKAVESGTDVVMGFNEPDHAAQANLSPEQACKDWTSYMEPIVSAHPGVTILGPSVTNGPAPMGLDWLDRFQKQCPDATWHGANIHFYDIYDDGTVDRFKAQVEKAAEKYNKPVWVTEFGLNPGSASAEQAATFVKGCMEYMDSSDAVQGYSYFMVGDGENMLNSGSGLSEIGKVYASA